ncbi:MAG: NAD(P)H-dependent glycerol-3-phosphate dehydrogenase [Gemmatales bacterium]|nr:NAD(P)-dependent glycerol-3-phosphate dehydrogenase [Gemmatales bacterium]MDW7994418.1 NAD(P)H-dependent glycerol-3-phosphate dehydrogenase [Gemmatales bacterium]
MIRHITVLGDGAMGTACALVLASKPELRVTIWSPLEDYGRLVQQHRESVRYLPGVRIPENIHLTLDLGEAVNHADTLVLAIPTLYLRATLLRNADTLRSNSAAIVSVIKGIEQGTFLRPTQIMAEILGPRSYAVLAGPSHAEEISRGLPASVVVASYDKSWAQTVQLLFMTERLRVYTNPDPVGVELCGALKNIIAIAAGISDGLGLGDNAKAALLTRALVEMRRFVEAHGGRAETVYGLAGIGDLITTCTSVHGRNLRVGRAIGQGQKLADILHTMQQTAEGIWTCHAVYHHASQLGLEMPISTEVYRILYEDKPPLQALRDLMHREPMPEY